MYYTFRIVSGTSIIRHDLDTKLCQVILKIRGVNTTLEMINYIEDVGSNVQIYIDVIGSNLQCLNRVYLLR